ncbi:MAG: hypothetical protein ACK502_10810 [Alphaproteobacteria bacterium]|jgi:hypothetical protein
MTVNTYTETDVAQIALSLIGGGDIDSITDPDTDLEATCARIYKPTIETLLSHEWNWAEAELELAKDLDVTPLKEFTSAFRLPANMLAGPAAVFGDGKEIGDGAWCVKGAHLYCSYTTVMVDYRKKPPVTIWPSYFVNLAAHALAAAYAIPVREGAGRAIRDEMHRIAYGPPEMENRGGLFAVAKKLDAKSKPNRSIFANGDPFTRARFGGW